MIYGNAVGDSPGSHYTPGSGRDWLGGYSYQTAVPLLPRDFSFIGFMATYNIFDFGKRERTVSERNTQVAIAEANVEMVKAKVAATVQKSFFEVERARKIRDLTRQLATMHRLNEVRHQDLKPDARAALAGAERDMYEAELEYRVAVSQLKRVIDGQ